jgi:Phage terminase, small subunit
MAGASSAVAQCEASTARRTRCKRAALEGSSFCTLHAHLGDSIRRDVDGPEVDPDHELADEVAGQARAEAMATLVAMGEEPERSTGAIDRYATAMVAWKKLEAEWVRRGRPCLTFGGATGHSPVAHPLIAQIIATRREAAEFGAALGLDPASRLRLSRSTRGGRPAGAASAADRVMPPMRTLRGLK